MSSITRQFGKLTVKGAGDDAKVQVLLHDFEQADRCLAQLIEAAKQWRDAWQSILSGSLDMAHEFEALYNPIVGASDGHSRNGYDATDQQLRRSVKLKEVYGELKADLLDEVNMVDDRIIRPATDAREHIKPMKKVVKKRDDKRLDYERYQDRVNHASKKERRSERDHQAFAKAQEDLSKATDNFQVADEHIRATLPPLIAACFSLLPHILAAQIMTQNTLLAQYYTVLHTYCGEESFPSPPPSMDQVIADWAADFKPIQAQAEAITMLARGQAVHKPMQSGDGAKKSYSGMNIRSNITSGRLPSSQPVPQITSGTSPQPGRISRMPSSNSLSSQALAQRNEHEEEDNRRTHLTPGPVANFATRPPSGPGHDYFAIAPSAQRRPSATNNGSRPDLSATTPGTISTPYSGSIVGKKKPPPPPPKPKRIASHQDTWVIALYAFNSEEAGDLSFAEGERIKVVKKTGSTDDWWEGEIRGSRGKFPANYCELIA